jgi:hypothetical protein
MPPPGSIATAGLLALALALIAACTAGDKSRSDAGDAPVARADATGGPGGGRGGAPDTGALGPPPGPVVEGSRDGAPGPDAPARDAAAIDRDGRIPSPPPGAPPCEPGAMAVHDQPCPYPVLVTCSPHPDTRPNYVCYCFAPPFSGKWVCQEQPDGGGFTVNQVPR